MNSEPEQPERKRSFLGLPIPSDIRQRLLMLQPRRGGGVRPIDPKQMHVTLHFIGQANPVLVVNALGEIREPAFTLAFSELGYFGSARRGGILWVGTERYPGLVALHQLAGERLQAAGIQLDNRPYKPHVTLARCRPGSPMRAFKSFLEQALPPLPVLPVSELVLYSSTTTPEGSVYKREHVWPLQDET